MDATWPLPRDPKLIFGVIDIRYSVPATCYCIIDEQLLHQTTDTFSDVISRRAARGKSNCRKQLSKGKFGEVTDWKGNVKNLAAVL